MAEAIARSMVEQGRLEGIGAEDVAFFSAGLSAFEGAPPSSEVVDTLTKRGIQVNSQSIRLTPEMARKADLILGMTRSHVEGIKYLLGSDEEAIARVHLVDPQGDVADPIGQGLAVYEAVANRFEEVLPERLQELFV